jgi:hypothetical protein
MYGPRHEAVEWAGLGGAASATHLSVRSAALALALALALDNMIADDGGPDRGSVVPRICLRMPRSDTELNSAAGDDAVHP